jgi:ceramide glucosyltransferase
MASPVSIPIFHLLVGASAAVVAASIAYCILSAVAGLRFAGQRRRTPAPTAESRPPVSILKPLKGADPAMYEALRSHCLQDYPDFEILCGITEADDPAGPVVERLIQEFPQKKIRLVLCEKRLGVNGKVSSLIQLAAVAGNDCLLVNDSDIRVEPNYLHTVIRELQRPSTGLVTCLYRGVPGPTLGSHLEAAGISTDFMPGVLTANLIEGGIHFGLGSTLAFRKGDLHKIGGFEALVDYLADDYELGRRIADLGLKVHLSSGVVETHLPPYDLAGFVSHQLRWARTIRASRPGGYAGLLLTFTLPWALAALLFLQGSIWGWSLFGVALATRAVMAAVNSRLVLRERGAGTFFLLPIRDFVAVAVWLGGLFGNAITWRGQEFVLREGKLTRK